MNSLARTLSWMFALSAALMLTGLAWTTHWALQREFRLDEDRMLDDTVTLLQTILAENHDLREILHQELPRDLEAFHFHRYQLLIQRSDGSTLYQSRGFPDSLQSLGPKLTLYREKEDGVGQDFLDGSSSYRVIRARAHSQQGQALQLLVALDTSQKTRTLATYSKVLVLMVLLGATLAALLAHGLVQRGLSPLSEMTLRVSRLRFGGLSQRLKGRSWPAELEPLAGEFDRLLDEVQAGLKRMSEFSFDLAHELKTPLTALRLEFELALAQPRQPGETQATFLSGLEELERLSTVIDRLLLLAQADSARQNLQIQAIELLPLLQSLCEDYFEEPVLLGVSPSAVVWADPTLLQMALGNLCSNAAKYGQPPFAVNCQAQPDWTLVSLSNGGPAIDPQHLPWLFERLYRVEAARSQGGHGLGLALVRSAMRAHGGEVEVTSEAGQTRFTLYFPNPA